VTTEISPALRALLDLMTDPDIWISRRLEAAKAIIEHEASTEVFDLTYRFLMGVAEDREEVELQLKALTLIRKVEARRVVPGTTNPANSANGQRVARRLGLAKRRMELVKEGKWPQSGWPEGVQPVQLTEWEGSLADKLENARLGCIAKNAEHARTPNPKFGGNGVPG
jgi:hypothetical protein